MKELIQQMKEGDRRALSRLLSIVEAQDELAFEILREIWKDRGKAFVIGVTGPAGSGKSSLIDQLVKVMRQESLKVGVIAVDPSSPFSGGAVLGDRVRMQRHSQDEGVFIRSIGSHGKSGGLSFSTRALVQLMDAYGCDFIIIETVGAGQSEVEIMNLASTTLVLLMPEAGDSIQALKAGIMEIADLYVVNKKDRPGADRVVSDIQAMLSLVPEQKPWSSPVLQTESLSGDGVQEVWRAILNHRAFLKRNKDEKKEKERHRQEFLDLAQIKFLSKLRSWSEEHDAWTRKFESGEENIYIVVDEVLAEMGEALAAKRPKARSGK